MQHALLEVWERRSGGMLTLAGYRESGGVQGAIAKRAESVFESFGPTSSCWPAASFCGSPSQARGRRTLAVERT